MGMLYEAKNSGPGNPFKVERGTDFSFPLHLHGNFEMIAVTEGEMVVTVGGTDYALKGRDAVLVFPHQAHALTTPVHSRHILCIFSPGLVQGYRETFRDSVPRDNRFCPSELWMRELYDLDRPDPNPLRVKGLLYSLCGRFDEGAGYLPRSGAREGLLERVFRFVEENYRGDCSLSALSREISYHYVYLSRVFKRSTGLSYTDYVNRYRVGEAISHLAEESRSVLQIAMDCGFDSLRSFNRNFRAVTGTTPGAYRNGRRATPERAGDPDEKD